MNKRKIRRYRSQRRNSGVNILGIIGIMLVAVICGYMTARFVIAPLLGYDTEVLKLDFPSRLLDVFHNDDSDDSDGSEKEDGDKTGEDSQKTDRDDAEPAKDGEADTKQDAQGGYALQYGVFSTKAGAEELSDKLKQEGIDAKIQETDGKYKVLSPAKDTKEEALELLKNTESDHVKGMFITKLP